MSEPSCAHCSWPLIDCTRGRDCPGCTEYTNRPCLVCFRGLLCPVHGDRWPRT